MDFPSRVPVKLNPRADFAPEQFRKFILNRGLPVLWEQATECPCKRRGGGDLLESSSPLTDILIAVGERGETREGRAECPACRGRGYYHHSPQTVVAGITRAALDPDAFRLYGDAAKGMIGVTLLPEHIPSYQDRFTLSDSTFIYRETRYRRGLVDTTKYPIITRTLDLQTGEGVPVLTDVAVLYCVKANSAGVVDKAAGVLVQDVDFVVTEGGAIDWTLGDDAETAPAVGDGYSINYYARPRYSVVDIPHIIRDTWVATKAPTPYHAALPVQAMCQMEFLVGVKYDD